MHEILVFIGVFPEVLPTTNVEIIQWLITVGISFLLIVLIFKWIFSLSGYLNGRRM